jgi:hypothetical protein
MLACRGEYLARGHADRTEAVDDEPARDRRRSSAMAWARSYVGTAAQHEPPSKGLSGLPVHRRLGDAK